MPLFDASKSYRQISTLTAPPGQIVLMLYEGAIRSLERALAGFSLSDPADFNMTVNNNVQRAREVINALNQALDFDKGGELANTLARLYDYFDRVLHESNVKKHRRGVEEVIRHLTELRDAWRTMLCSQDPALIPINQPAPAFAQA
jgi:flagellar secretion chaperone FliS